MHTAIPARTILAKRFSLGLRLLPLVLGLSLLAGSAIAEERDPTKLFDKMGCSVCHGADGNSPNKDTIPKIAGQMPRYIYLTLKAYKSGERSGIGSNMHSDVSDLLSDEQMKILADYVAKMK